MTPTLIWSLVALVSFIVILATKLPNWLTFPVMGVIMVFSRTMSPSEVYAVFNNSGLHLMFVICLFSGAIGASGVDIVIANGVEKMTGNLTGKKKELVVYAILYLISGAISFVMQNSYVALMFLPVMYSISKRFNISYSKQILFVIYASTLGGACTLIGTPTNVYANTAMEAAGLETFKMFDFTWVALPIFIIGGIYMVVFHRFCPSYEEELPETYTGAVREVTAEMKKKQLVVGIGFVAFVLALVLESVAKMTTYPIFVGYAALILIAVTNLVSPKELMSGMTAEMVLFCGGINLLIAMMKTSGLGEIFADVIINLVGESRNLYVITAILFIGSAIITAFMNNMATAGMLAPVGIMIAESLGADPKAVVLAIAIGAGCSFTTPIASGTNQTLQVFSHLKFTDYIKFGWPLIIINFVCCVVILPLVFPFF